MEIEKTEDKIELPVADDLETVEFVDTNVGKLADRNIRTELEESYLDYAMSVIVSRALPDVRDGMKPVHRRVLFAMHDIGLKASAKYRKSATVVGEVLGKYHPHGDVAVYDTMVRMAQDFSMRYPLVDGQGNFGSMDGDSAAAMRYTEAKMTQLAEEMLVDIEKDTVDFVDNYDGSRQEPKVLPARIPQLLLNGTDGIAVGMATKIPPHNLTELCDAVIHLIDNPQASSEDLTQFVLGPDFPTGGLIFDIEEIKQAYITGKGKVVIRAKAEIEEAKRGFRIIITEIPFQVNKSSLIQKIAELVKDHKIDGISDLRDESDRTGVRVVIELKANSYPKKILNRLFELTQLQTAFHVNMLALTPSLEPRVMNLHSVLDFFIKHRQEVIERRTKFDLQKAKDRAHILEGLIKALDSIDEIIATIKKSANREEASKNLIANFGLSEPQASAILDMRLSALAALERKKIEDEYQEKLKLITHLEDLLAHPEKILGLIKKDLEEIKDKYGDERRTQIVATGLNKFSAEDLIPDEQVIITMTRGNYVKRQPTDTYRKQIRGGKGIIGIETKEEDSVVHMVSASTHDDLFIFTDAGRIFANKVYELPATSRQSKGIPIVNIIQLSQNEKVTAILPIKKSEDITGKFFVMTTVRGIIKRTLVSKYQHIRKTGIAAIKLAQGDQLKWVQMSAGGDIIVQVSNKGLAICYKESDSRPMGRSASGVIGMKLRPGDKVVGTAVIPDGEKYFSPTAGFPDLLTVLENGFGKRTMIKNFHIQNRGGIGIKVANCTERTGNLVGMEVIFDDLGDALLASKNGQFIRMAVKAIKRLGRDTQGVTLMKMRGGDKVSSMTVVRPEEKAENNESGIMNNEEVEEPKQEISGKKQEKKPEKKISKPKSHNSELIIHNSKKSEKPVVVIEEEKTTEKIAPHNSLLEKPDDVMPTIRAYDPKVDLEIKKTEEVEPDNQDDKAQTDVNWWGKQ
ncbi:MAG: DNA gyrase subunit A [Candidatus Berkelbacteria bacterium]|nr:DNA gyrase subunit A [Candidatus Berkelbacteria bacterium]